jgi:hypothetical protein
MEGQGINGLVIGSSEQNPNAVLIKTTNTRTWISIVECISAVGVALDPLVIFKAKSIQDQWFKRVTGHGYNSPIPITMAR